MNLDPIETGKFGRAVTPGTSYPVARALWVGTSGNVNVRFPDGGSAIYQSVTGLLPVQSVQVIASGTTASNITTIE